MGNSVSAPAFLKSVWKIELLARHVQKVFLTLVSIQGDFITNFLPFLQNVLFEKANNDIIEKLNFFAYKKQCEKYFEIGVISAAAAKLKQTESNELEISNSSKVNY